MNHFRIKILFNKYDFGFTFTEVIYIKHDFYSKIIFMKIYLMYIKWEIFNI